MNHDKLNLATWPANARARESRGMHVPLKLDHDAIVISVENQVNVLNHDTLGWASDPDFLIADRRNSHSQCHET